MIAYTKTLELLDYNYLRGEVSSLYWTKQVLEKFKIPAAVQHQHRYWEYGMAIAAMKETLKEKTQMSKVLDIGAGVGLLGPTLSHALNCRVTEIDPTDIATEYRKPMNVFLERLNKEPIQVIREGVRDIVPPHDEDLMYDVVFCISTLEHMTQEDELIAWGKFDQLLKPGGVLFVTFDCMEENKPLGEYMFDDVRLTRFTPEKMQRRVAMMESAGYQAIGEKDFQFHGNFVYDYTFAAIGMQKGKEIVSDIELGM